MAKQTQKAQPAPELEPAEEIEEKHETPIVEKSPELYTAESWKGVKTVYRCCKCGTFRDDKDAMILHVIIHVPESKRNEIFDKLVKEQ